jgi:hypothetical protein
MTTTVPQAKPTQNNSPSAKAPKKGTDYVVAAPSHENPNALSVIMSVSHTTLEY